jgi:hypothetical protein
MCITDTFVTRLLHPDTSDGFVGGAYLDASVIRPSQGPAALRHCQARMEARFKKVWKSKQNFCD